MDAKCRTCGERTEVSINDAGGLPAFTCAACGARNSAVRGDYFRLPSIVEPAANEVAPAGAHDPDAEQNSHRRDLLALAEQTRSSLLPPPPAEDVALEAPPSVREAIRISATLIRPPIAGRPALFSSAAVGPKPSSTAPAVIPIAEPSPRERRSSAAVLLGGLGAIAGVLALAAAFTGTPEPPSTPASAARSAEIDLSPRPGCAVVAPGSDNEAAPEAAEGAGSRPSTENLTRQKLPRGGRAPAGKSTASAPEKPATPPDPAPAPDLMKAIEGSVRGRAPSTVAPAPTAVELPAFERGAANGALNRIVGSVGSCKPGSGEAGRGGVTVTFAPSGIATAVALDPGPFAGTPTGQCVTSLFRGARVPAFSGAPVTMHRSFIIN